MQGAMLAKRAAFLSATTFKHTQKWRSRWPPQPKPRDPNSGLLLLEAYSACLRSAEEWTAFEEVQRCCIDVAIKEDGENSISHQQHEINYGLFLLEMQRHDESNTVLERAIERWEDDPQVVWVANRKDEDEETKEWRTELMEMMRSALDARARILSENGSHGAALDLLIRSLEIYRVVHQEALRTPASPLADVLIRGKLAVYRCAKKVPEKAHLALDHITKAAELAIKVWGLAHCKTVEVLEWHAQELSDIGQFREALEIRHKIEEACQKLFGPKHPRYAAALLSSADAGCSCGEYETAITMCRKALSIDQASEATLKECYPWVIAHDLGVLGRILVLQAKNIKTAEAKDICDEAKKLFSRGLQLLTQLGAGDSPEAKILKEGLSSAKYLPPTVSQSCMNNKSQANLSAVIAEREKMAAAREKYERIKDAIATGHYRPRVEGSKSPGPLGTAVRAIMEANRAHTAPNVSPMRGGEGGVREQRSPTNASAISVPRKVGGPSATRVKKAATKVVTVNRLGRRR